MRRVVYVEVDYGEKSILDYDTNESWRSRDCKRLFVHAR